MNGYLSLVAHERSLSFLKNLTAVPVANAGTKTRSHIPLVTDSISHEHKQLSDLVD